MSKKKQKQTTRQSVVTVNTDPKLGPLDGAEAKVMVAKTVFEQKGEGEGTFSQETVAGNLKASYELGVVSISVPRDGIMFSVRIDEMMQVLFASSGAYKNIIAKKEEKKND